MQKEIHALAVGRSHMARYCNWMKTETRQQMALAQSNHRLALPIGISAQANGFGVMAHPPAKKKRRRKSSSTRN